MTSLLSAYWGPEHGRREDLDYFRKLQPADILILQPDVQHISDAYQASPESMITLRRWDWDDNRSKANPDGIYKHLRDDPEGYAEWLVDQYAEWVPEMEQQAKERGLPFPEREQLVAHHANEPDTNNLLPQINRSNAVGAELFRERLGMPLDGLNLSTGHPAILNAEGWPDWTPLAEALDALTRYDGYAVTHEYFNDLPIEHESVHPWHMGRHTKWAPRGPRWKIGEFNLEMLLNDRRDDHHGWQGIISEDAMIDRTNWYLSQTRNDVVAVRWFMTDFRDPGWSTFDSLPLHDQLIVIGWQYPSEREVEPAATDHKTRLPNVQSGSEQPTAAPEQPQPAFVTVPELVHPVADPSARRITQRFGDNPQEYAQFGLKGHAGVDFAAPEGTVVVAVDRGVVIQSGAMDDYGEVIKIRHAWGESVYAHLQQRNMRAGKTVSQRQIIGLSGNSGNSTGPHLHFAVRISPYVRADGWDGFSDPLPYLPDRYADLPAPNIQQLIKRAASEFGVEWPLYASLIWAESSYRPDAESHRGAQGLAQIMPDTWAEWAPRVGAGDDPFDARDNLRIGAAYMRWLLDRLGNEWSAVSAYNWGIGNVLDGNEPPEDTVIYIRSVLHGADLLREWVST